MLYSSYGLLGTRPSGDPKSLSFTKSNSSCTFYLLIPVTLEINGTVRLERGLTDYIKFAISHDVLNIRTPLTLRPSAIRRV